MKVNIKLDKNAYMPKREHPTDAGADIRTPKGFTLMAGDSKIVHTGIHIETPENCAAIVKSKSGLYMKNSITTTGVVDEGFTGEVLVKLLNHGNMIRFEAGDKIAQLLIVPVFYPEFEQVDEISGGERGDDGFGSTGR